MADKYFAIGSVGSFLPEQEVVGLEKDRYKELEEAGKIRVEREKTPEPKKTDTKK